MSAKAKFLGQSHEKIPPAQKLSLKQSSVHAVKRSFAPKATKLFCYQLKVEFVSEFWFDKKKQIGMVLIASQKFY